MCPGLPTGTVCLWRPGDGSGRASGGQPGDASLAIPAFHFERLGRLRDHTPFALCVGRAFDRQRRLDGFEPDDRRAMAIAAMVQADDVAGDDLGLFRDRLDEPAGRTVDGDAIA